MADQLRDISHQERESARSLELFVEMLDRVHEDSYYWKWAIIALHNACHGFMVLALEGIWPVLLLSPKKRQKVLEDQYSVPFDDRVYTDHIMSFLDLFESIQSDAAMTQSTKSQVFASTESITESISALNRLRNEHIHFRAMTYIRDVPAFVPMSVDVLEVIDFLLNRSGNIWWNWSQVNEMQFKERSVAASESARMQLAVLESFYSDIANGPTTDGGVTS